MQIPAQNQALVDSLSEVIINKKNADTTKIKALTELSAAYAGYNNDTAEYFGKKALKKANEIDYPFGKSEALYYLGILHFYQSSYDSALYYYQNCLEIKQQLGDDHTVANLFLLQGMIYDNRSQYTLSLKKYLSALDIYKKINYKTGIASAYDNIGTNFYRQNKLDKSLEYLHKSLSLVNELKDTARMTSSLNNLGVVYNEKKQYDKSLKYYKQALAINRKLKNVREIATNLNNIGMIYKQKKAYDKAEQYLKESLSLKKESNNKLGIANTLNNLGSIQVDKGNPENAVALYEKSIPIAKQIGSLQELKDAYSGIYRAYKSLQQYKQALKYHEIYAEIADSILNIEKTKQLEELEAKYENKQKQKQIELLNKENQVQNIKISRQNYLIWFTVIVSGLMLISLILLLRYIRFKNISNKQLTYRNTAIEEQQQEIIAQNEQLEQQARQLKELDRLKSRFFANISHEFRTPLTLITGPLEQIIKREKHPEKITELKIIQKNALKLLELINQLLDLARIETGRIKLKLQKDNIVSFLRTLINSFTSFAVEKGIELTFTQEMDEVNIYFDKDKVEKILFNLLSNAFKFTPQGGKIKVRCAFSANKDYFAIEVEDTGTGIARNEQKKIFDRFYQSEKNSRYISQGTGIGLALCKELIELHKGQISLESIDKKGSIFTVLLPTDVNLFDKENLVKSRDKDTTYTFQQRLSKQIPQDVKTHTSKNETARQKIILLVEDNEDMRLYIKKNLSTNYKLIEAINGRDGLILAKEYRPDLIIADVMMPVLDGLKMTEKIKSHQHTSHIPVIVLTARASQESIINGYAAKADAYITKPFSIEQLNLQVNNLIEIRQKLRNKFQKSIRVSPSEITTSSLDEQFLSKALEIVEKNLANSEFNVGEFCNQMGVSRTNLHRKLRALTRQSASEFIRSVRLKRAAQLLKQKSGNVSDIAYAVGFSSLSYFAKCFKEQFNVSPSDIK